MERRGFRIIATISAAAMLSSCSQQDNSICEPPPSAESQYSSSCVHRTAYQYAHSAGTNTELAKAVTSRCSGLLLTEITNGPLKVPAEFRDNNYVGRLKLMEEEALDRIVQAKAGNCDKPK